MKSGWEKYATKARFIQKGYFRKHSDGGSGRKAREASRRDSVQQSRKEQKEEMKEYSCREGHQFNAEEATHSICGGLACPKCPVSKHMGHIEKETAIQSYGKIVRLTKQVVPNEPFTADKGVSLSIYELACKDLDDRTDGRVGDDQASEESDIQPSVSCGSVLDVQTIPEKPSRSKRKASNPKKDNERSSKKTQKGE